MLYSFFISIDRRKNSWKPVELHKIGEEFSGCETTISPVSVFLSLPLELFASLSLIFQYGGRPHSPNLHHISSSRSRTNFLIYTWKSALESRIIGSLFAFLKPVHFYLTFCQRYYLYTMIPFSFFFFSHYFPFFNTPRMRYARVSRSTGLSQRNSDTRWGYKWIEVGIAERMGGGSWVKQSSNTRQWQIFVPCTPSFSTRFKVEWGRKGAHYNP